MFTLKINVKSKIENMKQWVIMALHRNYETEEGLTQCLDVTCKDLGLTYVIGQDSVIYFKDECKDV